MCKDKSVALIGNGPSLLSLPEQDKFIESHDLIIRLNAFDTKKTPETTGTRTDLAVVNGLLESLCSEHFEGKFPILIIGETEADKRITTAVTYINNENRISYSGNFRKKITRQNDYVPSTGMSALLYLVQRTQCKSIYVTGFSFQKDEDKEYYHDLYENKYNYWKHPPDKELELFKQLITEKNIQYDSHIARVLENNLKSLKPIINLHFSLPNVGDQYSPPAHYFPVGTTADVWTEDLKYKYIILGGGGMFFSTNPARHRLFNRLPPTAKIIIWGAGHNYKERKFFNALPAPAYPSIINKAVLIGMRDINTPYEWVPCASCMSPLLDNLSPPKHKIVCFWHHSLGQRIDCKFPQMTNEGSLVKKAINFIASGETVITTSYHGAYWASLLNKKVIVYKPFSSKFYAMKHSPYLMEDDDLNRAISEAPHYPDALRECREANVNFCDKVLRLHKD